MSLFGLPSLRTALSSRALTAAALAPAAVLLFLLCARVWGLGITHTDDAMWGLLAYEIPGNMFRNPPIHDWAIAQGRIWAYVAGAFILTTLKLQGTLAGELLRMGGFAGFFVLFHLVVRAFCGARIAVLAAVLNAGLFMVRWDGSLLTTYPLLTWVAGIAFAAALLLAKRYVDHGGAGALAAAAGLLFFSLFNNEGITATFCLIALGTPLVLVRGAVALPEGAVPRARRLAVAFGLACAGYAAVFLAWWFAHPTTYDGHKMSFALGPALQSLLHFSTGGNVIHDLFSPYRVVYADAQWHSGQGQEYRIGAGLAGLWTHAGAVLAGLLVAGTVTMRLRASDPVPGERAGLAMAVGLLIALLVNLPVALTAKYQSWVVQQGIRAYSHTAFTHFGWSLALAAALVMLHRARPSRVRHSLAWIVGGLLGLASALAAIANDRIVDDMRAEAGRWRMLEAVLDAVEGMPHDVPIVVPTLGNGTWYTVVHPSYWSRYAKSRYGEERDIRPAVPQDARPEGLIADYALDRSSREMVGIMALMPQPGQGGAGSMRIVAFSDAHGCEAAFGWFGIEGVDKVRHPLPPGRVGKRNACISVTEVPASPKVRLVGRDGRPLVELDLAGGHTRTGAALESAQ